MSNQPRYRHGGPVPDDVADDSGGEGAESIGSIGDRVPIVGGLVAGAGAFLATYVLATLTSFTTRQGVDSWGNVESPPHVLTEASWTVLLNLGASLSQGGEPLEYDVLRFGLVRFATSPVFTLLVFAIVVVAGYVVADCARTESRAERVGASLLVVPAYVVFAAVFAVLSAWEPPAEAQQVPEGEVVSVALVDAIVYAGILVPAMLALLGGLLAVGHRAWAANRDPS